MPFRDLIQTAMYRTFSLYVTSHPVVKIEYKNINYLLPTNAVVIKHTKP